MRIPRIYQNQPLAIDTDIALDSNGIRHINTVLRMQAGQTVELFDGKGHAYQGTLTQSDRKSVRVLLQKQLNSTRESPLHTHIGQAISRGERMDYALQKAVEMGVSAITPLFSQRCEVKLQGPRLEKRLQQWQHLIIAACEQCGRNHLPTLHPPQTAQEWFNAYAQNKNDNTHQGWLMHPGTEPLERLWQEPKPEKIFIGIGPEGGFEDEEIERALAAGFNAYAIGPRILRTETAPVAALSLLQLKWGDFT